MTLQDHLLVVPVVLPMILGAIMLFIQKRNAQVALGVASCLGLVAVASWLVWQFATGAGIQVYQVSNWPAPYGIMLVADHLSALMLALAAVLGLTVLVYASVRWDRAGVHFHPLFQLMLMGINGAFLTGDLFNLFVFFEIMLAASYGLVLHGSGPDRVKAGLHYIVINTVGASLFLIGIALIYGVMGTLNLADLAAKVSSVSDQDRPLLEAGAAILAVAFLTKSAIWPLNFWLVPAYTAATPPVAAIFAVLSKVGVYAVLRIWLLLSAGAPDFGDEWLLYGGMITLLIGTVGLMASQELNRLASYSLIVSSGTLLAAIGFEDPYITASALYYLVAATLACSALFLLVELLERTRTFGANVLALTLEAFQAEGAVDKAEVPEVDEVGKPIPMGMAFLGLTFVIACLIVAGLPPLVGFLSKFALLASVLEVGQQTVVMATPAWILIALLFISSLAALLSMSRAGIRVFWAPAELASPRLHLAEAGPVAALILVAVALTVGAGPATAYLGATAEQLYQPEHYSRAVIAKTAVPPPQQRSPVTGPEQGELP
ncbi:MAG: monovalent cation/H+ antiporter subunit D [Pigmentiphaga sp.]